MILYHIFYFMNKTIKTLVLALLLSIPAASTLNACYVDLSMHDIQTYTGPDITFYNEYNAQEEHYNQVSFPIVMCDPLTLENATNSRWFFSSAIEGPTPYLGEAIAIINQSITHVYAVRGQTRNGNWAHIYFGLDAHNPKFSNETYRVYQGNILHVKCKNRLHSENSNHTFSPDAKYLDSNTIAAEITSLLPEKYWDNDDPLFQRVFEFLFLQRDDSYYVYGHLVSSVCYWTQIENTLKGTQYEKVLSRSRFS